MESHLRALERWASEQGKVVVELKVDMTIMKKGFQEQ